MLTFNGAGQGSLFAPDTWCGKTSPEPSHPTTERTSGRSSRRRSGSQNRTLPTFHYLPKGGGRWLTPGMETDGPLPTAFSTLNFGECPSVVVESRLSQILEDTPPSKYFFVRKGVCGDTSQGDAPGEETAAGTGGGTDKTIYCLATQQGGAEYRSDGKAPTLTVAAGMSGNNQPVICLNDQGGQAMSVTVDATGTLRAQEHGHQPIVAFAQNQLGEIRTGEVAGTLNTNSNASGRNAPLIYDARGNGDGKIACTITGDHEGRITDYTAIVMAHGQSRAENLTDVCPTLNCNHEQPIVARPLTANHSPVREDMATYPITNGALRRLTPLECERLQGYPDGWTDIGPWVDSTGKRHKESSDAARYKALGNSIALPPWAWVLKRLCACYERPATMASLFDGIGGFPLLWERLNGPGTCLWASEIEKFPIAVTKKHFGEEDG